MRGDILREVPCQHYTPTMNAILTRRWPCTAIPLDRCTQRPGSRGLLLLNSTPAPPLSAPGTATSPWQQLRPGSRRQRRHWCNRSAAGCRCRCCLRPQTGCHRPQRRGYRLCCQPRSTTLPSAVAFCCQGRRMLLLEKGRRRRKPVSGPRGQPRHRCRQLCSKSAGRGARPSM